jgi:hypothetical protein
MVCRGIRFGIYSVALVSTLGVLSDIRFLLCCPVAFGYFKYSHSGPQALIDCAKILCHPTIRGY